MKYKGQRIAHLTGEQEQTIKEHLQGTAIKVKEFVADYKIADIDRYAYITGMAHDIGKYSDLFQKKLRENPKIKVDHSTAGAIEMQKKKMMSAAFCVAGHHTGIPNGRDTEESCLLKRIRNISNIEDYSAYKDEINLDAIEEPRLSGFSQAFFIRMLFSALVDADFLDTERFMSQNQIERGTYDSFEILYKRLKNHIRPWLQTDENVEEINKIRTNILKNCIEKGKGEKGLYSLTVPTGGGKTISSLAFAMEQLVKNKMKRIIYVIPYTSIIEQNADVFRDILGDKNIVEHHANAWDNDNETEYDKIHRLSVENWDAPVIVTTNVQFFESLYANKGSKCRKLHNIANSVIIFDEAQMIPLSYLKPCVRVIEELVINYNITALLCTATQPALDKWFEKCKIKEICDDFKINYSKLKRTEINDRGILTKEELIEAISSEKQILVIVNKRKTAQEIYKGLSKEDTYHLSTYMTPEHRRKIIQTVRKKLKEGETVRLISTSLIEAGVDIDFPVVWRERAGIDSIVQAAGRCNREGKRELKESIVWVFELEGEIYRLIEKNIAMTRETLDKYGVYDSLEAIQYYFTALQNLDESSLDHYKIMEAFEKGLDGIRMPFKTVGEIFKLIEENTKMLIIPVEEEAKKLIQEMDERIKKDYTYKRLVRKVGRYAINLRDYEYDKMMECGQIYEITEGIAVLQLATMYKKDIGLDMGEENVLMF